MMRFREVREVKRDKKVDLGFDPDKLIAVSEEEKRIQEIVREARQQADDAWNVAMVDVLITN